MVKSDHIMVEELPRSRRPSMSNTNKNVKKVIDADINFVQKQRRKTIAEDMIANNDLTFIKCIITSDDM